MKWGDIMKRAIQFTGLCLAGSLATGAGAAPQDDYRYYHGDAGGTHYSRQTQINAGNVGRLKEAWRYDLGRESQLQNTPPTGYLSSLRKRKFSLFYEKRKEPPMSGEGISKTGFLGCLSSIRRVKSSMIRS